MTVMSEVGGATGAVELCPPPPQETTSADAAALSPRSLLVPMTAIYARKVPSKDFWCPCYRRDSPVEARRAKRVQIPSDWSPPKVTTAEAVRLSLTDSRYKLLFILTSQKGIRTPDIAVKVRHIRLGQARRKSGVLAGAIRSPHMDEHGRNTEGCVDALYVAPLVANRRSCDFAGVDLHLSRVKGVRIPML